jgi:single-strand DNA-binding protein
MRSINKVIIIGNLTRDPEMRQTPSGQSVTTFGVATNRTWITKNTDKKSEAEYHEVVAWGNLAEICAKYLKKGKLVYIEGYLKTRSWDTPEGMRRFKTEIVVQDMIMLDKKGQFAASYEDEEFIPDHERNIDEDQSFSSNEPENSNPVEPAKNESTKMDIDGDLGL